MSNDNIKKSSVEPVVLCEVEYDGAAELINTLEDDSTLPKRFNHSKRLEINRDENSKFSKEMWFEKGESFTTLQDFEDIDDITITGLGTNAAEHLEVEESNFTQGTKCIKFDKNNSQIVARVGLPLNFEYWDYYKFLGHVAVNVWFETESDAQNVDALRFYAYQNGTTDYALFNNDPMYFKRGWNVVRFSTARSDDSLTGTFEHDQKIETCIIDIKTNNTSDALTDVRMDNFRIYNGSDCYVEETLEDFSDYTEWTPMNGVVTNSLKTRNGSASVSLAKTSTTLAHVNITKTLTTPIDISKSGIAKISFYVSKEDYAKCQCVKIRFADTTKGIDKTYYGDVMKIGWNTNYINLNIHDADTGSIEEYESFSEANEIRMVMFAHNVTDTLEGVVFDSIEFPGDEANNIDLPIGTFLRDTLITISGTGTHTTADDKTCENSRHSLEFSELTNNSSLIITDAGHDIANSNQIDITTSDILAYDYYIPSGDISDLHRLILTSGAASPWDLYSRDYKFTQGFVDPNGWNTHKTQTNAQNYNGLKSLGNLDFRLAGSATQTFANAKFANLRVIKPDLRFRGKNLNASLKRWHYQKVYLGASSTYVMRYKPMHWHIVQPSDFWDGSKPEPNTVPEPERNTRPYHLGDTIRLDNDSAGVVSLVQDTSSDSQRPSYQDLDAVIDLNNTGYDTHFSVWVYCEAINTVSLSITTDQTTFDSLTNQTINQWERLEVIIPEPPAGVGVIGRSSEVEQLRVKLLPQAGIVDICEPKLIPWNFGQEPNYKVLNTMDNAKEWQLLSSFRSATFPSTQLSEEPIDNYYTKGISFAKTDTTMTNAVCMIVPFTGSLSEDQILSLDIWAKDATAKNKILEVTTYLIRNGSETFDLGSTSYRKLTSVVNQLKSTAWSQMTFSLSEVFNAVAPVPTDYFGSNAPRFIAITLETKNTTDTLAEGDVVFSNLRIKNVGEKSVLLDFDEPSDWSIITGDPTLYKSNDSITSNNSLKIVTGSSNVHNIIRKDISGYGGDLGVFNLYVKCVGVASTVNIVIKFYNKNNQYLTSIAVAAVALTEGEWYNTSSTSPGVSNLTGTLDYMEIDVWLTSALQGVEVLVDTLTQNNFISIEGLTSDYTDLSTTISGDSISSVWEGYGRSGIKCTKANTSYSEFGWIYDNSLLHSITITKFCNRIYMPIFIPLAEWDQFKSVALLLSKDVTGWSNYMLSKVYKADLKAGEWNLVEFDFNPEAEGFILTGACDGTNCLRAEGRIYTNNTSDTFSNIIIGNIRYECTKLSNGGINQPVQKSLIVDNFIGYYFYIPDSTTLKGIKQVNLTLNKDKDYTDSRFYKTLNEDLKVGWNRVIYNMQEDYYLDTFNNDDLAKTFVDNVKIWVESYDGLANLKGLRIDRIATYTSRGEDILRVAKVDVLGTENGKYWQGKLEKAGKTQRKMSHGKSGLVNLPKSSISIIDTDNQIADIYAASYGASNFLNNAVTIRSGAIGDKESELADVYKGYISNISFKEKVCTITSNDTIEEYMLELPTTFIDAADWSELDEGTDNKELPLVYGEVESDFGALPLIYLGDEYSGNKSYYAVAGHACLDGSCEVFFDGKEISSGSTEFGWTCHYSYAVTAGNICIIEVPMVLQVDNQDHANDEWKNPWEDDITDKVSDGSGGWEDDDISKAPDTIGINIHGKTFDGTTTGTLIIEVIDVFKDFLFNELGLPESRINTDSFTSMDALLKQKNETMSGAIVENANAEEIIANMMLSHNMSIYTDKQGKLALYQFAPQKSDQEANLYTDENDIILKSFKMKTGVSNLVNRIRYRGKFNYSEYHKDDDNSWEATGFQKSDTSIQRVNKIVDWEDGFLECKWNRNDATVNLISQSLLLRYEHGRPQATCTLPMGAYNEEIAERIRITHYDGVSLNRGSAEASTNWQEHLCVITSMTVDNDKNLVTVDVDNVQDLSVNCAYLGDRDTFTKDPTTLICMWNLATTQEQEYLYLCDRSTGMLEDSDGNPVDEAHGLC